MYNYVIAGKILSRSCVKPIVSSEKRRHRDRKDELSDSLVAIADSP